MRDSLEGRGLWFLQVGLLRGGRAQVVLLRLLQAQEDVGEVRGRV